MKLSISLLAALCATAGFADNVRYRGVMSPVIPVEADFRDLAAMGGNLMRFQMNGNGVTRPAKVETKDEKLAWFDTWIAAKLDLLERNLIPWARQYGVKLVVDMHDSPGGRDREHDSQVCMYYDADYAAKFVATWREIARRFAGHEDIIYGYDLFNEPNEQQEPLPGCDYWNLQVRAGKAVREFDTKTPIIIAAKNWDLSRGFRHLKPVPLDNVIYQVHIYDPHEFTHQGLGNDNWTRYPGVDPKTGRTYNKDFLRETISPVVAFQREHGVKIYVGEFSALGYADGAADYIRDVISLLEEQGWDWTYHAWREWSGWSVEHVCVDRPSKSFVPATVETDRMRVLKEGLAGRIKGREDLHDLFAAPPKPADVVVDPRVRTFVNPTRIVDAEKVARPETLLRERFGQVSEGRFTVGSAAVIQPGGRLVLDYGRELHGGLQLGCGPQSGHAARVRVRFGESVAEAIAPLGKKGAMNDHAIRDGIIDLPWFGQREIGNTGFRFVALENVGEKDLFVEFARAVSLMRPWTRKGDFYSSDARVNAVFETSVRTAHLCAQEYLWDGIKRDRLVWIGDFHPEVNVILSVFGAEDVLEKSLEYAIRTTPPDTWANGMSSYTCWLVRDIHDLWYGTGDLAFVRRHADYLRKTTDRLAEHVDANGFCTLPSKFLDWPTRHNEAGEAAGCQALMAMAFDDLAELATALGDAAWTARARDCAARLRTQHPDPSGSKQAAALLALGGLQDAGTMYETVLGRNGCAGVSTFYGYYMLEAMSRSGHGERALETIRDYWGGMLDVGATSFWEDFNLAWTNNCFRIDEMPVAGKKDIHGDYGEFCYRGFRHSLCHGWSSGPAHWLIAHALGLTFAEPGGRTVRFAPESVGLAWAEGALATPFGPVRVRVERQADGSVAGRVISAPAEVKVVGP